MRSVELIFIAVGLSMDAFAVAITLGLAMQKANHKKMLAIGTYFGVFQAGMPLLGYFLAAQFADKITQVDHWIAFILLAFIGGKMIIDAFKQEGCKDRDCPEETCTDRECPGRPAPSEPSMSLSEMIPLAIATSIDALAVGVSFAFLKVDIISAASLIGLTTLIFSMVGVKIGRAFGARFKSKATLIGGIILVGMGLKILLEHVG